MKTLVYALMLAGLATVSQAGERPLVGTEIRAILTDATAITPKDGGEIIQVFYSDRRTFYQDERPSWGLWEIRNDQYCSNWPPSASWVCYDMFAWEQDGRQWVVWIGESGTRYEAYIRP